ncbi:hypothetical protein AB6878_12640 [Carnobacterium maltaromaticum]|uniref:hypothetical protein n=1 Tax=Carnobacterium maltaromaticum TaxID=2751 RepID=UPI0039BE7BA0
MSKYKYDEVSTSNLKILLTIFSCASLVLSAFNAKDVYTVFITATTYYLSNALAFYSLDIKSESGMKRKAKIINHYLCIISALFICLMIQNSLKFEIVKYSFLILMKLIVFFTSFIAPYYALKDDDSYEAEEIKDTKKKVKKTIKNEKEKKPFKNRDNNVRMNKERKNFVDSTDRKRATEGGKR